MSAIIINNQEPLNVTRSTSKIMNIQGSHIFRIEGFSFRKGMGVGKYIASDTFSVGESSWKIHFYPDGDRQESGDIYVAVFLKLVSKCEEDLTIWVEYYLLDQNGNRWQPTNLEPSVMKEMNELCVMMQMNERCLYGPSIYNASLDTRGYTHFYKRTDLDASQFVINDCLTIQCSVVMQKTTIVSEINAPPLLPLPLSDLKQSYEQLLESKDGSDVSFDVAEEIFYAHKIILSTRSPVFKAQFFGPLKDKDDDKHSIKIKEMRALVFKALLHFIYCDVIPDPELDCEETNMTQHLLAAADRYDIQTLKSQCESKLCENIAIDSASSTLAFAEQHGCIQLKSRCIKFIVLPENLQAVMQTDGFKTLSETCPAAMCELLKCVAQGRDLLYDVANAKRIKSSE